MPAVSTMSKDAIIERWVADVKRLSAELDAKQAELSRLYRKIDHGCANFQCEVCDHD